MGRLRIVAIAVLIMCINLAGCGKKYSDFEHDWVSDDRTIQLTPHGQMIMDLDEIDQTRLIIASSDVSQTHIHIGYCSSNSDEPDDKIWEATATIRGSRLYLKIEEDYVSDYEGTTFIFTQSEDSSNKKMYSEYDHDWVSADKKVRITPDGQVTMNVLGADQTQSVSITQGNWEQDLWFYYGEQLPKSSKNFIWQALVDIREDTLYLSIYEDRISDYQGKIVILKQEDDISSEEPTEK